MSNSKTATSANTASTTDPSLAWPNVRITSSTSIQTIVSSSLLHLSDPSSAPLILHTLPSPSNSSSSTTTSIIAKNSHAGLCKLISVVEIIKREFENHQKESWRLEDEKLRKKLAKKNEKSTKKGKKRAREEEEDEADQVEAQATNEQTAAEAQVDVAVASTSKDTSTTAKHKKKQRPLLRVYQYNILDAYERLPGASTSSNNNEDADSPSSDSEDDDNGDEDDEARESSKVEADLVKSKIKAAKSLNGAIHTHVIRAKKRPKKKHTPYMKIILSTCKLTEYETYLKSSANKGPKEYTIQLPPAKKSRSRTPKKRKHKKSTDEGEEGEVAQGPSSTQVVEKDNVKLTANQSEAFAKNVTKSKATQADDDALVKQDEKTLTSSNKKAKKRKADDMETQSTDATQKSSQLT